LLRVILDSKLRISPKARIVGTASEDLLVFTAASLKSAKARKLQDAGIEVISLKTRQGKIDLHAVMKELGKRDILSILLEAGPGLNGAALEAGIVHNLVLFYAPKVAGKSAVPFVHTADAKLPALHVRSVQQFGPDIAVEVILHHTSAK
jgi:diaminohydroxyphosphoribosylaminopyrimidine deaminase/5-amino-6-(5-phosphoribosylamino)uracil reductase